jgi:RHS repeat-associated protein
VTQEKLGSVVTAEYQYDTTPASTLAFAAVSGVVATTDNNTAHRRHMKTWERVMVMDGTSTTSTYVERAFYYDSKGRVIQTVEKNHLGGISRTSTQYDFTGNVLASHESHRSSSSATADTKQTTFTLDHRGRATKEVATLNGNSASTSTVAYAYDDLGQLTTKTLGTGTSAVPENYTYNIQGWLTGQSSSLFDLQLHYTDPHTASYARWGGDIAEIRWMHKGTGAPTSYAANAYSFTYDKLGRVTRTYHEKCSTDLNPTHYMPWGSAGQMFQEDGITYDRNGNILTLSRVSTPAQYARDYLTYTYTGNRLTTLAHNNATGSVKASGSYGYTYDANGNMTRNARENLDYGYNLLNLLGTVKEGSTTKAQYRWLADGTKAGVRNTATGTLGYEYLGSLIYKRTGSSTVALEGTAFGGGRINKTSSSYEVNYQIADHLGSPRVVFKDATTILARNDYYAFGKRHANPGLPVGDDTRNRWLYNGKERQTTGNVGFFDYGARMYDPEIARWTTVDPLAEKYYSWTPYVYVGNNPVRFIDPTGMSWKDGWQYLKQSFSLNTSLGFQIAGKVKIGDIKVGGELNFGSMDILTVGNNGIDINIANGDRRAGAELGIGVAALSVEQVAHDNNDNTATRTTVKEATVLGVGVKETTVDTYHERGDGSYVKDKNAVVTTSEIAVPDKMEIDAKAIIGIEIEIDSRLFIHGLDEIFKDND